jgi:hypothetical protein
MKALLFFLTGFFLIITGYREGQKKVKRNPLAEVREIGERMRQEEDARETLSKAWARLCKMYGVRPESVSSDNCEFDAARQDLVYAACGVWRDPLVIDAVASRLPGLFKNWQLGAV